jgi:hypothetical protein
MLCSVRTGYPIWLPVIVALSLSAVGCVRQDDLAVWKAEMPSPNGQWIATVKTIQNGGFGSASVDTIVYLKRKTGSQPPQEVLAFSCHGPVPHPYALDNVANKGGTIDLAVHWVAPAHLEVTYTGRPDVNFQVVRYQGVEISAQDLSDGPTARNLSPGSQ